MPVAALVVSFCTARSREGADEDEDGRANISEARSSYAAWVSRGCWPKRPKAHGAAVDVGNREKGACMLEEEDILACCVGVYVFLCVSCVAFLSLPLAPEARWVKKRVRTCEGHAPLAYIPARMGGSRRKQIGDTLCSISGIVQFTRGVSRVVRFISWLRSPSTPDAGPVGTISSDAVQMQASTAQNKMANLGHRDSTQLTRAPL